MRYVRAISSIGIALFLAVITPLTAFAEDPAASTEVIVEPAELVAEESPIPTSDTTSPTEPEVSPAESPSASVSPSVAEQPSLVDDTAGGADSPVEPTTSRVVVSEVRLGGQAVGSASLKEYVTLSNLSDDDIALTNWQLQYAKITLAPADCGKDKWTTTKLLSGTLTARQSTIVGIAMNDAAAGSVRVMDDHQVVHDMVGWGASAPCFESAPAPSIPANDKSLLRMTACDGAYDGVDTDNNAADFTIGASLTSVMLPECTPPPVPPTVNHCDGLHLSEIGANREDQFVELYNSGAAELDLTGCQVQTNRSTTKSVVFDQQSLAPAEYVVLYIKDTPLTLTKTTVGTVYLLSSDGQAEIDSQTYSNLAEGTSWALLTDGWRQTYAPTPGLENIDQPYLPCDDGYVRNEITGRCNKLMVTTTSTDCGDGKYRSEDTGRCRTIPVESVLAACKLGQYRSEETNRCRNLVSASALKPCKDDQYRSEETNRCRNIVTASAALKPCRDDQYRSEETNRCRNIVQTTAAVPYKVEQVTDSPGSYAGWWALGGVLTLAIGYGVWEWRSEIGYGVRRVASLFRRK